MIAIEGSLSFQSDNSTIKLDGDGTLLTIKLSDWKTLRFVLKFISLPKSKKSLHLLQYSSQRIDIKVDNNSIFKVVKGNISASNVLVYPKLAYHFLLAKFKS